MEGYKEDRDYKAIHIEWIKTNRGFRPRRGLHPRFTNYLDEMMDLYYNDGIKFNKTAYIYLKEDYEWSKKSKDINSVVAEMFGDVPVNNNPKFFVTFNWSDKNFNVVKILDGLKKLFKKSWIDEAQGVFEYHGLEGNHPHLHCVIQVNKHKTIGRFRDKIFQSAIAQTLGKNFIDVKVALPRHDDYIQLDKRVEKTECLENDKTWRFQNGLMEFYTKQNI